MGSETDSTQTEYAHIVHTPGLLGGEARIAGFRIRARDVMVARDRGGLTGEGRADTRAPGVRGSVTWYPGMPQARARPRNLPRLRPGQALRDWLGG